MTLPIRYSKSTSFVFALTLILSLTLISFTGPKALAQATGSGSGAGNSETCDPDVRDNLETRANEVANSMVQKTYAIMTPPPTSADLACIPDGALHFGNEAEKIFSANPEFCSGSCDKEMADLLMDTSITPLGVINISNLFSQGDFLSNLAGMVGNLLGFSFPSSCPGPEQFLDQLYQPLDPVLTRTVGSLAAGGINPAAILGNPVAGNLSAPTFTQSQSANVWATTALPKGQCQMQTSQRGSRTVYNCLCGPETTALVERSGSSYTCRAL